MRSGKGIYRTADGTTYTGRFLNDEMSGKGIYRYNNGDVYEGDWIDGKENDS